LLITPHLPNTGRADGLLAYTCNLSWRAAFLSTFLSLLAPASAWADIYKWTDEQGNTVISNVRPTNPQKLTNFELIQKEAKPAATPMEQVLLDRIDSLERRLQTQPYSPQLPAGSPASYYGGYYPLQPPLPPPPPSSYSSYPPSYYPSSSYDLWMPSYSYIYPARLFVNRPNFRFSHNGSFRGSRIHHGRR
jgi:Domain of unknown function (DUF4124)